MGNMRQNPNYTKGDYPHPHRRICQAKRCKVIRTVALASLLAIIEILSASAQSVQHLNVTEPGGFPGIPVLTGIELAPNGVTLNWDGPSGYYQIWHKTVLTPSAWLKVGAPNLLTRTATIADLSSNDFFRVSGPPPAYAGASACETCHGSILSTETLTKHAGAFTTSLFVAKGGQTNPACLVCHSVGYGLATGFVTPSRNPQLEGVQCENCHGPAANHAANFFDPAVIPQVELAAQVCGGCHSARYAPVSVTAWHPPFFENWSTSPHATVTPDALSSMNASAVAINNCGRCHSGSARLALIAGEDPGVTMTNDFSVAITCAVCHDPHAQHVWTNALSGVITFTNLLTGNVSFITNNVLGPVYTNQLLAALNSTSDFFLTTSTNFTSAYNPGINGCAQCHNDLGAAWTDTAWSPHASPQYNMLLGTVGELAGGPSPGYPSTHSRLEMQCAGCHMQETNNASGHTFKVASYQLCYNCHTDPSGLVQLVTNSIAGQIQATISYLNLWATNAAASSTNAALATLARQYGTLTWQYTTNGDLSTGPTGPNATGQALIPDDIKMARFDLNLVISDGSFGVHNGPYDIDLLENAQRWIESELYQ
jgi:hypothetical protein